VTFKTLDRFDFGFVTLRKIDHLTRSHRPVIVTGLLAWLCWTPSGIVCRSISTQVRRVGGRVLTSVVPSSPRQAQNAGCVCLFPRCLPPLQPCGAFCLRDFNRPTTSWDEAKLYSTDLVDHLDRLLSLVRFCTYTLVSSSLPAEL
jgi:hypothetical protein